MVVTNVDKVAERHEEERGQSCVVIYCYPKGTVRNKNLCLPRFVQLFSPNHVLFIVVERNHSTLVINAMKDLLP